MIKNEIPIKTLACQNILADVKTASVSDMEMLTLSAMAVLSRAERGRTLGVRY